MENIELFEYCILKDQKLILLNTLIISDDIANFFQRINDSIVNDIDYEDNMNLIISHKMSSFPDKPGYYNDLDRRIVFSIKINKTFAVVCPKDKVVSDSLKIFDFFAKNNADYTAENIYSKNLYEIFEKLNINKNRDLIYDFFCKLPSS